MGQVPHKNLAKLGIVGDGRVARHFAHYFTLAGLPFRQWSRRVSETDPTPIESRLADCETVLLLIRDSAIVPFIHENPFLQERQLVHFSGSLSTPLASGMHPLMTFGFSLYDLGAYQRIPFVCELGARFGEVFPSLPNPSFSITPEQKALYHSLCVMSGNFTVLLWRKMFEELEGKLGIPREAALPYLAQISANLSLNAGDPGGALTGPLVRGDMETIQRNLDALEGDPFQKIYRSFVEAYQKENSPE
jgi:2-dehydropantoate 2-reductase